MAEEVGDSVCIIDSPNQSPNDGRRATFDFAALQLIEQEHRASTNPSPRFQRKGRTTSSASQSSDPRARSTVPRIQCPDLTATLIDKVEEWLSEQQDMQAQQSPKHFDNNPNRFLWELKKSVSTPVLNKSRTPSTTIPPFPINSVAPSVTSEAPSVNHIAQTTMGNSTLSPLDERQIRRLIGDSRLILLPLYQASVHGFDTHVFHSLCDKRGPSVTIVTLSSGLCFGCYTSAGWFSRGEPVNDKKAFLFRAKDHLCDELKISATQSDTDLHIYDDPDLGPFFGSSAKPTLRLFCKVYGAKSAQVYSGGPFEGGSLLDLTGVEEGQIEVTDIEVFDASQKHLPFLERPWREVTLNQPTTLAESINYFVNYKPEFCQIEFINVLLLGPIGSGKSSVFNTFESTFKGHITSRARTGDGSTVTTKQFRRYMMQPQRSKDPLNIRICDTPGLSLNNISSTDLVYMMDGHLSDRFNLTGGNLITNRSPGFNSDTSIRDEMHCIALVLDATKIPAKDTPLHSKILELKEQMDARDIPIRVLLTKTDLACKLVESNLSYIYRSCTVTDIVEMVSTSFSLPRNYIYPMKCYEHEIKPVQNIGILALSAFRQILYAAESGLEDRESLQCAELAQKLRSGSNLSGGSVPAGSSLGSQLMSRDRSASDNTGSPVFRRSNSAVVVQTQVYHHSDSMRHRHSLDLQRADPGAK
ncbi:interferon-induced protein 44-like [Bolinopsis microptera]|uniref:interferon-induced protein 44-like n=1 Tax=Bolinopsis microptera TaxID=2820187 RepID=UPI003079D53E